ncbi:MAG: sensor histidine kinase, partial [Dehalococcoidia bacterium]|nr:sensor histidine kinase [Dehalococcoidia bacterium]
MSIESPTTQRCRIEKPSSLRYPRSIKPDGPALDSLLMEALLNLVLGELPGVEGGYWHEREGFVAYAYPTHQGSEPKKDVPSTE